MKYFVMILALILITTACHESSGPTLEETSTVSNASIDSNSPTTSFDIDSAEQSPTHENNFSLEGDIQNTKYLETLWGLYSDELLHSVYDYNDFLTVDRKLYYYRNGLYNSLDLDTLEQEVDLDIYELSNKDLLHVYTTLNVRRDIHTGAIINDAATQAVFYNYEADVFDGEGLYYCELTEDNEPVRVQEIQGKQGIYHPLWFVDDELILVKGPENEQEEQDDGNLSIIDLRGNIIKTIPILAPFYLMDGVPEYNAVSGILIYGMVADDMSDYKFYYYDYATENLEKIDWMTVKPDWFGSQQDFVFDTGAPGIMYIPQNDSKDPYAKTSFYRIDFNTGMQTDMQLSVTGANIRLLAANNGTLLFAYANEGEQRICVYNP